MAQQSEVSFKKSATPSKLLPLIALILAFMLPFVVVKSFSTQQKINHKHKRVTKLKKPYTKPTLTAKPLKIHKKQTTSNRKKVTANLAKNSWTTINTKTGDSLASIFKRLNISQQSLQLIIHDTPNNKMLTHLKPNQPLKFIIKNNQLEKLSISFGGSSLLISKIDKHYKSQLSSGKMDSRNQYITATVHGTLYSTARHNHIPYNLIHQMTKIFALDISFAKDVRTGDQFTILYNAIYSKNKFVKIGNILAVTYKKRGKTFQAVRHTSKSGHSDYFTPEGHGLKQAFNRYPLQFSHIGSPFSLSRFHPILHYARPHKGVDLAAALGTPIKATGDGRIEVIGRQSDYGNMIKIIHDRQFSSIYGHMLRFKKGLSKGKEVKRGEIIGYVGQTGLASGPHCHYEFHVNRQPKNPVTVNLPRENTIPRGELPTFKANTLALLTQLKLLERTKFASIAKKDKALA